MAKPTPAEATKAKTVTIKGRLSFPSFTHTEAVARARRSTIPAIASKPDDKIGPEFNVLIEQDQLDKLKNHIENVFIPYVEAQAAAGEKRDVLDPKVIKKIQTKLGDEDWDGAPHLPMKPIDPKYQDNTPECVASVKVTGRAGSSTKLLAKVTEEDQLDPLDPDVLSFPVIKPINETVFDMYPGAYVAVTLNLYAFNSSTSVNGISAGGDACVYLGDLEGERIGGGGGGVDEDAIFMLD